MTDSRTAVPAASTSQRGPQLIAYADRFGGDLAGLSEVMTSLLEDAFDGVHILPFYRPFDGSDAGFDPEDHTVVDIRLGGWEDVRALAHGRRVMGDVIINHLSSSSVQFQDFVARGDDSEWAEMFLTLRSVFPNGATEDELAMIYRPRPGLPFTAMTIGGQKRLVWTTFTERQVDLDIRSTKTWQYLTSIVDRLTDAGVTLLRLDAVGYTGKRAGTDCFMSEASDELVQRLVAYAHQRGAEVLLEVHGHYAQQIKTAQTVDYVYDFALPPLVLHAILAQDAEPLARWLQIRPANAVTVLDTHDGIGIVDVRANASPAGEPGLLSDRQVDDLVEAIHENSGGTSRQATGTAASNVDLYQVNCTFYDALGARDDRLLLARLIQLFVPGVPQVYYVGLMAGRNDIDLLRTTGVGRDINRHYYSLEEIQNGLEQPVVRAQLEAVRFRATHPAFGGTFEHQHDGSRLILSWRAGQETATLDVDLSSGRFQISSTGSIDRPC